jgi:hypothetical protein
MNYLPVYFSRNANSVFGHSRGAGEVGKDDDPAGIRAASIPTEMFCRVAQSVKFVVIARFASLEIMSLLHPVIRQIESLLFSLSDPVLFNRTPDPTQQALQWF